LIQELGHVKGTVQFPWVAKLIFQLCLQDFEDFALELLLVIFGQIAYEGVGLGRFALPAVKWSKLIKRINSFYSLGYECNPKKLILLFLLFSRAVLQCHFHALPTFGFLLSFTVFLGLGILPVVFQTTHTSHPLPRLPLPHQFFQAPASKLPLEQIILFS
jgi:hypothetical protein